MCRSSRLAIPVLTHAVGVSLMLRGQFIPNNSLVNFDDFLYNPPQPPTYQNANGLQPLMCVTDLVACCEAERLGNWYYPGGGLVNDDSGGNRFELNRGQNEVINGQQFYGSVRIWRRYTPLERGIFRCELPDASGVTQTLYVNISKFPVILSAYCFKTYFSTVLFVSIPGSPLSVSISSSGSTTAGETYSLTCSATLNPYRNPPLPDPNIPSPTFEWFFGPNGNTPLPSGVTPMPTVLNSGTYTSTLQFSPLTQSHTGNYTCQLGAGSLLNSAMVTVNGIATRFS